MNQEQLEIEKNLASLLVQLGIEYDEHKIAELKTLISSETKAKNSLQPIKKLYEIEEEEKQLNDLLVQTKTVAEELENKIRKEKEQRDQKKQQLNEALRKVKLLQQIYKIKKQTEDIEGENQSFKMFFKHFDEKLQQKIMQKFKNEADSLIQVYKSMMDEKKSIQDKIQSTERQKMLIQEDIQMEKKKGEQLKEKQEDLNKQIERIKEEQQKKKLFREREKSRRQMKFFSSLSNGSVEESSFYQQKTEKVAFEQVRLPVNEWEKNKYYIIILGLWTLALGGLNMF